ncbi:MAG: GGDEF domain-containing protein [Candidatus Gracilibacteria bacterium]
MISRENKGGGMTISNLRGLLLEGTDGIPKYVDFFTNLIANIILKNSAFNKSDTRNQNNELAGLIENKFLTILFRRISRKLKKQKFFEKEELFKEIKYLLETYLNGKDKILKQEGIKISIYHLLGEKDGAIDYINVDKGRKSFLTTEAFLSKIGVPKIEKESLESKNYQCFRSISPTSGAMCVKNTLEGGKIIFYFDGYNSNQENILKYLMEDLAFVIKEKVDEIDYKYTSRITGCKNRTVFNEHAGDHHFSVMATDLDNFKYANDTFGHISGDEILKKFGELLRGCVRKDEGEVIHLSGDEFCIMVKIDERGNYSDTITKISERINKKIGQGEFSIDLLNKKSNVQEKVNIKFTMGICENKVECGRLTLEQCYEQADIKMLNAKGIDGIIYRIFKSLVNLSKKTQIIVLSKIAKQLDIKATFEEN